MTDLIWIGNTLYPRWMVFAWFGLTAALVFAIQRFIAWMTYINNRGD